jgi:chaperonin GroES
VSDPAFNDSQKRLFKTIWHSLFSDKKILRPLEGHFFSSMSFSARGPVPDPVFDIANLTRRMCMHFRPLHDRVLVRRIDAEEKTAGGIIIPDTAKEKPQEGEIVAAGPGARNEQGQLIPIDVEPGDRVLFGKWSGTEVKIDGQDYLIMKESDLLGVVEKTGSARKAA